LHGKQLEAIVEINTIKPSDHNLVLEALYSCLLQYNFFEITAWWLYFLEDRSGKLYFFIVDIGCGKPENAHFL
jgi:hypothetical protein